MNRIRIYARKEQKKMQKPRETLIMQSPANMHTSLFFMFSVTYMWTNHR